MANSDFEWKKFSASGKIEDYCSYRAACRAENPQAEKGNANAPEHRGLGDTGTEYR